ncbi:MAG TPA: hypothetical protein VH165_20255 [Kofleriaceae bacterium]|nr:hypothetical protein [Kofleriaceae bacterium]
MEHLREAQLLDFWRHPAGAAGRLIRGIVAFASLVTVAIAVVGPRMLWSYYAFSTTTDPFWFRNGLAILLTVALVAVALPRGGPSRWLRLAVALPFAHALAMAIAWARWTQLSIPSAGYRASLLIAQLPIGATVEIVGLVLVASAWLIARGRRGELGHTLVALALASLLLLGLWLSIASDLWCRVMYIDMHAAISPGLIGFVVVPPWAAAVAFIALVVHRPDVLIGIRTRVALAVFGLSLIAVVTRLTPKEDRYIVFGNFVHVLLAVAFVAVTALVVLGIRLWLRGRRAAAILADTPTLTGVVAADGDPSDVVAWIEIPSWLRGPRAVLRPFVLATSAGDVPVPGGTWVSPLAASTTQLQVGESVGVLHRGDRVVVAGMVAADAAHPFRSGAGWLAGAGGVAVAVSPPGRHGLGHVVLALWRPCVAYLAILIAIGIPSLASALFAR